jgi:predicted PP-loop superfamily ATPase
MQMTTKQEHTSLHKIHYTNFQTKIHICFRCHHVRQNRMMEPLSIKIITLKKMVLRYYSSFFLNYLFIGTSRKQHGWEKKPY